MLLASSLLLLTCAPLQTQTVVIPAEGDATLIESPDGSAANGQGPHFFVGRTGQGADSVRRGLLRFDIAGHVPAGARIESAALTLYVSQTNAGPVDVSLHRVLADWSEGPSYSTGGQGAPASPGDTTWLHRFYAGEYWAKPGGHFVAIHSASTSVAGPGSCVWEDEPRLLQDVQLWSRVPSRNFGWALVGDETMPSTVKRFDSRENPEPGARPLLVVSYSFPAGGSGKPWSPTTTAGAGSPLRVPSGERSRTSSKIRTIMQDRPGRHATNGRRGACGWARLLRTGPPLHGWGARRPRA